MEVELSYALELPDAIGARTSVISMDRRLEKMSVRSIEITDVLAPIASGSSRA